MIRLRSEIVVSVNNREWRLVSNLRDAGPTDAVFILDSQSGSVRFGNGVQGAKPPVGSTITVSYRQGTGCAGNIPKKNSRRGRCDEILGHRARPRSDFGLGKPT